MANLFAAQGAGNLLRRLVEAAGSCEATLYDCAVVVYNLAGAILNVTDCSALYEDLVGENGVLPALEALANVRWTIDWTNWIDWIDWIERIERRGPNRGYGNYIETSLEQAPLWDLSLGTL